LTAHRGTCTVRLQFAQTRVPAGIKEEHSTDTRQLGALIDYFKYAPPK
jgi:hypothetical protein